MILESLSQPPFNTSLVGVIHGALHYLGFKPTAAETFVRCGHGFVTNVSGDICPSSPYVWRFDPLIDLLERYGLKMEEFGTLYPNHSESDARVLEDRIRAAIGSGAVCSVLNMDNQLILGYDDDCFHLALPWNGDVTTTPPKLSFGSWSELDNGVPVGVYKFSRTGSNEPTAQLRNCLDFAVELWHEPKKHAYETYGMGPDAYRNWLKGIDDGHSTEHGNWWNGMVWSECKANVSEFFAHAAADSRHAQLYRDIAEQYRDCAQLLLEASDRSASADQKTASIVAAAERERNAVEAVAELTDAC